MEFDAVEKQKDRDLQLQLAHMKDQATMRAAQDKMRFDGDQAKQAGQHKTNEMLIKAGKPPLPPTASRPTCCRWSRRSRRRSPAPRSWCAELTAAWPGWPTRTATWCAR